MKYSIYFLSSVYISEGQIPRGQTCLLGNNHPHLLQSSGAHTSTTVTWNIFPEFALRLIESICWNIRGSVCVFVPSPAFIGNHQASQNFDSSCIGVVRPSVVVSRMGNFYSTLIFFLHWYIPHFYVILIPVSFLHASKVLSNWHLCSLLNNLFVLFKLWNILIYGIISV